MGTPGKYELATDKAHSWTPYLTPPALCRAMI